MKPAPSGTVAFLFTDIEGSTVRWEAHPDAMKAAVRRHDALVRAAIEKSGGHVFKTVGDAFCAAFATVSAALGAALEAQRALAAADWGEIGEVRVRMAIHAGAADEREGDYFGQTVNRVARLLAIGHGGQILLSATAAHLVRESLPETVALRDLGEHRLKDLSVPERVYQATVPDLRDDFAALRSLDVVAHNLPFAVTSFVGRSNDLEEIASALETSRLVTLAGPGGVGKTRLALQTAAALLPRFADGVWLVELAAVTNPDLVAHEFAVTLRAPALPAKSVSDAVVGSLNHKDVLLIVDNCEHVVGSAAALIDAILRGTPGVRVIATSRQPLDIPGEIVRRVGSLEVPPPASEIGVEEARSFDSVKLFEERAHAASGFTLGSESAAAVAQICRSLDGLPLAIELAAPKLSLLSPTQLAKRLNERMRLLVGGNRAALQRQQTLRALIDWSHDLLDERERTLFRLLAAFSGGWTLEAAEAVCSGAGLDREEVLEVLGSLVTKSLVVADSSGPQTRYRFLESIREYAAEQLTARGERGDVARQHAHYHAGYVREQHPLCIAMDDRTWQRRIAAELDNIRGALDWSFERGHDARAGLEILAHFRRPRLIFLPSEAVRWFDLGATYVDADTDVRLAAMILTWRASTKVYSDSSAEERIAIARDAVDAARRTGNAALVANALNTLAICLLEAGRTGEADAAFREADACLGSSGEAIDRAELFSDWARCDLKRGDVDGARAHLNATLDASREGSMVAANALAIFAEVEFAAGDLERARNYARSARKAFIELGALVDLGVVSSNLAAYAIAADDFDDARREVKEALSVLRGVGAPYVTLALENRAVLFALTGEPERAAHLLGFTDRCLAAFGLVREGTERIGFERARATLLERFGTEVLAQRMNAGAAMSDEEALAYGLEIGVGAGAASLP